MSLPDHGNQAYYKNFDPRHQLQEQCQSLNHLLAYCLTPVILNDDQEQGPKSHHQFLK